MALPKWITPAGNLGIIPELEYYDFPLDAYDASGGTLVYSVTSGRLPLGILLKTTGSLQGIPVSELGGDTNVEYRFTIRVKNQTTGGIADRTFKLTVTNVAPPIIVPRNSDLGLYLDGTIVDLQLQAVESTPGADLAWSVVKGELPPGLSLSTTGKITGYIEPIPEPGPGSTPGWDLTPWNNLGWDFVRRAITKTFSFTIEVFDGVNYDQSTYTLKVFPRSSLTADNDTLTVDTENIEATIDLSVDSGVKHDPIITTTQDDLIPLRQGSFLSFNIDAIDLEGEPLEFSVPVAQQGSFDEQDFTSIASLNYVPETPVGGYLVKGAYPKTSISDTLATITLYSGNLITANVGDYISQSITGANSVVYASVVGSPQIEVTVISSGFAAEKGNLALNGVELVNASYNTGTATWSNVGIYPETVSSGEPLIIVDYTTQGLVNGDDIKVLGTDNLWHNAEITDTAVIRLAGNTRVTASAGNKIKQNIVSTTSNIAEIDSISDTTGTLSVSGELLLGTLTITGNLITANIGDFITQTSTGANATVTSNVTSAISIPVRYTTGMFTTTGGNIRLNGVLKSSTPSIVSAYTYPVSLTATAGSYITQTSTGANAMVLSTVSSSTNIPVKYISGNFSTTGSNIALNGVAQNLHPTNVICETDLNITYLTSDVFYLATNTADAQILINGVNTNNYVKSVISVGVNVDTALSVEGDIGFDEGKFDQGTLALPTGLSIESTTGWLIGQLPTQTINEVTYDFEVLVRKRDDWTYQATRLYQLTVLGDLNNRIDWITPSDLGTIQNGNVSDLFVKAISTKGKVIFYKIKPGSDSRLPQGLSVNSGGLLTGRVSFEMFSLDAGATTIDGMNTSFDETYTFTVTVNDLDNTISADRTFTIRVIHKNIRPYENLYIHALPSLEQRDFFSNILRNKSIFPPELIYRSSDPWFGLTKEIRSLWLAGLSPSTLEEYITAMGLNHFQKRMFFDGIRTAQALDANFNVKYEVVYLHLHSDNDTDAYNLSHSASPAPARSVNLTNTIDNPYYDKDGNAYTIAYPNSNAAMEGEIVDNIGYDNKGALPDWMTSRQEDGRQLGFVHGVVLAYTVPGASKLIAYRLQEQNFNFNTIDFTIDRYQVDNNYTDNYNIASDTYQTSLETTFDRYPVLSSIFRSITTVDYASDLSYENINNRSLTSIRALGGIDGINNIKNGDLMVFATQEFRRSQSDLGEYNQGWSDVQTLWSGDDPWDSTGANLTSTSDDLGWDQAGYVPGHIEHNIDPNVPNKRIGVWQVNVSSGNIVTLEFIQSIELFDKVFVRNGQTYGSTNIYYDPVVKEGDLYPKWSIIPQEIKTVTTMFDGNGTRFFDYRDEYSEPGTGDKYIKFPKLGVFN